MRSANLKFALIVLALTACYSGAKSPGTDAGTGPGTDAATQSDMGTTTTDDAGIVTGSDAATGTDSGIVTDPYNTPVMCTSGTMWSRGNHETMRPGETCISCHASSGEGPGFDIAGTVFPSAHEPDDCNGKSSAQVVITDANNQVITLNTNSAGNFMAYTGDYNIALPYHAKVVTSAGTRSMFASQTSGDCNTCHTEAGAHLAPGRIMAP